MLLDGLPAVRLNDIADTYYLKLSSAHLLLDDQPVATLHNPAATPPVVRDGDTVYVPVTMIGSVTYVAATGDLSVPHSATITTSVNVRTLALSTRTVKDLLLKDQQQKAAAQLKAQQLAEAQRKQQALAAEAARQARIQQQAAQQRAAAAAAKQAQVDQAADADAAKTLQVAQKAAPGMPLWAVGNGVYGVKIKGNKLFVQLVRVANNKVTDQCHNQTLDGLYVTQILNTAGTQGAMYVTFNSVGGIGHVAYTLRRSAALCDFTPLR
ncbi:hypothetical protein [Deinococcus sonorensis]|uniref:Uncharacterized protein n=2 Tax=Deinococcus sonorensis TaxID=309891 RepID=A0AAU7UF13_9DEIO